MDKLQRYSMNADHSLGRRRRDHVSDSDHYHNERSHEGSKRKDREEETVAKAQKKKKKSRFEDVSYSYCIASSQISEAVKRAQKMAAKMGQEPTETAVVHKPTTKVPVLRLDALGREVDEHGLVISSVTKPRDLTTLKVNINKHKREAFQILEPQVNQEDNPHFDQRMGFIDKNKILRPKRISFKFVEQGQWTRDAVSFKFKTQFCDAKPKELKVKPKESISGYNVEWWDENILVNSNISVSHLKIDKLTHYVEHPRPIEPLVESSSPPPQPLKLTKKEQKKLRTQRRVAKEKEKQEMIRLGFLEPPKAKVKMSNLMKILASEATQDPTKLEKEICKAAAEREQAHMDRNEARKLTPGEKREKKERKLFDDPTTVETIVSVYMIKSKVLHNPKTRFKVEMNARQNILTGCSVMTEVMSVVVVEGKSKAIKRYGKLMLRRINWEKAEKKEEDEEEEEDEENGESKCWLVWQGSVLKPSFHRFHVQECLSESAAKKVFMDAGVAHYWDLALNYSDH